MKNQSCDGFPGSVTQSGARADAEMSPRQAGEQLVAGRSGDRMMVTTDTAMPRSDGKGRGKRPARTRKAEDENEIEEREAEPLCCTVRGV